MSYVCVCVYVGRAIAEADSPWLTTATARVRSRVWQVGFEVNKMASGQVFRVLRFPLPKTVHSTNFSIIIITITPGS
jgi:hypothetical protein